MKLADSWIARAEALHYGFGEDEFKIAPGTLDIDTDVTTIRAGLSVRFN
jgi:opacity protein-like surface antigen